jgi:6-pyruvoyltetrahydropterin/6-carboxytetrahydropterin synthase
MFRVTRQFDFCYGHRLLNYDGKCRHLHGHNGRAVVTLEASDLDGRGMVIDFSQMKRCLQAWIDDTIDHKMLLHQSDPIIPQLQTLGEQFVALEWNPTAENIARWIYQEAAALGLPVVEVTLWETANCCATYRAASETR